MRPAWVAILRSGDRACQIGKLVVLAALFTPLVVLPGFFFPYVTTRAIFFWTAVEAGAGVLLFLLLRRRGSAHLRNDPVLLALLAFLVIQTIAALTGLSPLRSMFGDFERMWGVWGWAHLIIYYFLLRLFFRPPDWPLVLRFTALVGTVVAAFGIWGTFLDPEGMGVRQSSTVGNPGFFAALCFWTAGILALLFFQDRRRRWRAVYVTGTAVAAGGIVVSGTRSMILGAVVACGALVLIRGRHRVLMGLVTAAVVAIVVVARERPAGLGVVPPVVTRIASTGNRADAVRLIQGQVTFQGLREFPLLGVGPENFDLLWSRHFDPAIYRVYLDARFDRAHNAFLEALATSGILGGIAFMLVWAALFAALLRAYRARALSLDEAAVCAALYVGYASYLMFWFVDISSLIPWIVVSAFVSSAGSRELIAIGERRPWTPASSLILTLAIATFAGVSYVHGVQPLRVAHSLLHVERNTAAVEDNLGDLYFAFDSPAPQKSHTLLVYSNYMEKLAPEFAAARANPYRMVTLDHAFRRGLEEFDAQLAREPDNPRTYLQRARVLMLAASFYGNRKYYQLADNDLRKVMAISPGRIPPRLALSGVRVALGDTVGAVAEATRAIAIDPGWGESHFYLGQVLVGERTLDSAATELMRSLTLGYIGSGKTFREVAVRLSTRGSYDASAAVMKAYVERKYGSLDRWRLRRPAPVVADSSDRSILLRLPLTLLRAGRTDEALAAIAAASAAIPGSEGEAHALRDAIGAGKIASWLGRDSLAVNTAAKTPGT